MLTLYRRGEVAVAEKRTSLHALTELPGGAFTGATTLPADASPGTAVGIRVRAETLPILTRAPGAGGAVLHGILPSPVSLASLARRAGTRCGAPGRRGVWHGAAQQSHGSQPDRHPARCAGPDEAGDGVEAIGIHGKKPLIERDRVSLVSRLGSEPQAINPHFWGYRHRTPDTMSTGRTRRCTVLASVETGSPASRRSWWTSRSSGHWRAEGHISWSNRCYSSCRSRAPACSSVCDRAMVPSTAMLASRISPGSMIADSRSYIMMRPARAATRHL